MTVYHKVKCTTKTIYRSKKSGKKYDTKEEFLKENPIEDIASDVVVQVPDLPIFSKTKK
jgi:ASC-1-like (ASCH) protein|tara:strand:- start:2192 stop:2368 length:177 start_codon:yes stop_codon:yes gene_type:complete